MKLAIVGSRTFCDFDVMENVLDEVLANHEIDLIVSGGAVGADTMGIMMAKDRGIPFVVYRPDWEKGRQAGFERNTTIANECDILLAFWDGKSRGTNDTINKAKSFGKVVIVHQFDS